MMLSFPKLVGLLAVIWLVWMVFRFFEARQKNASNHSTDNGENKSSGEAGAPDNEAFETSVDLQECELCGVWFSGETCERDNCPN